MHRSCRGILQRICKGPYSVFSEYPQESSEMGFQGEAHQILDVSATGFQGRMRQVSE